MKMSFFLSGIMLLLSFPCLGQKILCKEFDEEVLTCQLTPAGPVPTAYDPNGVYPYVSYVETSNRPNPQKYHFILLENNYTKVTICPDLGGKVVSMITKPSGKEVLCQPGVVRYERILPRFYFTAGGIEVSFPISHSPSQNEKLLYKIDRTPDRMYVTCGERELRFGMQYSIEYSLGAGDNFLTERVVYHNPGSDSYPWMSWSNAALPSEPDTRYFFPQGRVLRHSSHVDTINWQLQGPKTESDIKEMTGFFWETKNVNAFGAYTPSMGTGLYHMAEPDISPGIKLWSYGRGEDSSWAVLSTLKHQTYIEIQAGPLGDQSIKAKLRPGQTKWHEAYWLPTAVPLDIYKLKVPNSTLRPLKDVPLFEWARPQTVLVWQALQRAAEGRSKLPPPPAEDEMLWAPSGMEHLAAGFQYAIRNTAGRNNDLWRFYYGTWLAGREEADSAIDILARCNIGLAKALLGRLLFKKGDLDGARKALDEIKEPWLQLHPQVIVERDRVLRGIGLQTIPERAYWLNQVNALKDEWVLERRVQLLIDENKVQKARFLLLHTPWQKVHQTYIRTGLWMQICKKEGSDYLPIPKQLGEDKLARFGAYREYK